MSTEDTDTAAGTDVAVARVVRDTYCDSLRLLVATSVMSELPDVTWAGAVMATPQGRESLAAEGFGADSVGQVGSNDLVLAVRAGSGDAAERALDAGAEAAFSDHNSDSATGSDPATGSRPRTLSEAVTQLREATIAIVSVSGDYAALEAHHALTAGLHVLLFSDNVPLDQEVELKERAERLGLLVMGPGAGTAVLSGTGLGFANRVRRGPVGVVAAAGTGAQEVSALLDRWGVGVSHVIGVGGRDLSADVNGRMARMAVRALRSDPDTSAILIVSKPPDATVARAVLAECGSMPVVATFLGLDSLDGPDRPGGFGEPDGPTARPRAQLATTLEGGAAAAARTVGISPPSPASGLSALVAQRLPGLDPDRRIIRGYFSGGTLCYEAQLVIGRLLRPVHSNEPLLADHGLPAPPGSHVLLDLGAEEYTMGRPHPMIDPSARIDLIRAEARHPDVAVVLLDVVLGDGAHADPVGELAPVLSEVMADGGPRVVAYVLGTDSDPQGHADQRAALESLGCLVTDTAARAARVAAAIADRRPALAEEES